MKLVLAIVSNEDGSMVSSALTREGFSVTKLATTGGFLMAGNTTFIVGTDDDKVDKVIEIISTKAAAAHKSFPTQPIWILACIPLFRWKSPLAVPQFLC